jgi:O-antigen/teichoic acid export membrane protein
LNPVRKLAGQTLIYGMGTIVPRFINYLILVPFYTRVFVDQSEYGIVSELYAYMVILLVILTYGMETAYFRFAQKEGDPDKVYSTSVISLLMTSTVFFIMVWIFRKQFASLLLYPENVEYVLLFSGIVATDAFCAIPFARLRQQNRALKFSLIKIINVLVIVVSVIFLLYWAPGQAETEKGAWILHIYEPRVDVVYVFVGNLIGSLVTLVLLLRETLSIRWKFDWKIWKKMMVYALPLLIAGLAGSLNDALDKMALKRLLTDQDTALKQLEYIVQITRSLFLWPSLYRCSDLHLNPFSLKKQKTGMPSWCMRG